MMYACCSVSSAGFIDGATTSASQSHITTYQEPLVNPVLRYQGRYPLKLQRIIRHQHGTGDNCVPGDSYVDRGAARRSTSLISVVASTAAQSQVRTAHRTRQPTARGVGGLRTCGAKAHLGVSDNRDHDTLVTQHRRLQALQHHFRLLAHDERADVGVEHVDLVHRSNRPSSLTTSPRSTIKSGSAFSSCANEHQVGRTGRRMIQSPPEQSSAR